MIDARDVVTNPGGNFKTQKPNLIGIAVHHSVSGTDFTELSKPDKERAHIAVIDAYHVGLDYGGFGYHAAAFPSGRLYQCGDLDGARAHVAKRNHELLGVVMIGDFSTSLPGAKQQAAVRQAIADFRAYIGRDVPVQGHTKWAPAGWASSCPGRAVNIVWDAIQEDEVFVRWLGLANPPFFDGLRVAGGDTLNIWTDSDIPGDWKLPSEAQDVDVVVYLRSGGVELLDGDDKQKAGYCDAAAVAPHYRVKRGTDSKRMISLRGVRPESIIDKLEIVGYWRD